MRRNPKFWGGHFYPVLTSTSNEAPAWQAVTKALSNLFQKVDLIVRPVDLG